MKQISNVSNLEGVKVLLRTDFNCPLLGTTVKDSTRIQLTLPTIQYLQSRGAIVIMMSHLGRPKGAIVEELRMKPIQRELEKLLNENVYYNGSLGDSEFQKELKNAKPGDLFLLENIQFSPGEKENCDDFARDLATLADIYVNDGFGQAHRKYTSQVAITQHLESYAGLLMEKEISSLTSLLEEVTHPALAIMGGVKIDTKMGVVENLEKYIDTFIFGGGIANTLLYASGYEIGASLAERDAIEHAQTLLGGIEASQDRYLLPEDVVCIEEGGSMNEYIDISIDHLTPELQIMDIGRNTVEIYLEEIKKASFIIWNGPLGYVEDDDFRYSTEKIVRALAESGATTLVGGGDSLEILSKMNIDHDSFTHVSSGGGAMLQFLEGKSLPGIDALNK